MTKWNCPKCKFGTNTESLMREHAEKIHGAKFSKPLIKNRRKKD